MEEQNRSRRVRDKSEGERRKIAHAEYQKKRSTVKRYIRQKERSMKKQNDELETLKKSDAKTYWTKLKNYLGLGKMDQQQLPKELKIEQKVVSEK